MTRTVCPLQGNASYSWLNTSSTLHVRSQMYAYRIRAFSSRRSVLTTHGKHKSRASSQLAQFTVPSSKHTPLHGTRSSWTSAVILEDNLPGPADSAAEAEADSNSGTDTVSHGGRLRIRTASFDKTNRGLTARSFAWSNGWRHERRKPQASAGKDFESTLTDMREKSPEEEARLKADVRSCMRAVVSPVFLITTRTPKLPSTVPTDSSQGPCGMTVSSLTTVTLDPKPIVSFNAKMPSRTFEAMRANLLFYTYVLADNATGAELADIFTKSYDRPYGAVIAARTAGFIMNTRTAGLNIGHLRKGIKAVLVRLTCKLDPEKCVNIHDHTVCFAEVIGAYEFSDTKNELSPDELPLGLSYARGAYRVGGQPIFEHQQADQPERRPTMQDRQMNEETPMSGQLAILPVQANISDVGRGGRARELEVASNHMQSLDKAGTEHGGETGSAGRLEQEYESLAEAMSQDPDSESRDAQDSESLGQSASTSDRPESSTATTPVNRRPKKRSERAKKKRREQRQALRTSLTSDSPNAPDPDGATSDPNSTGPSRRVGLNRPLVRWVNKERASRIQYNPAAPLIRPLEVRSSPSTSRFFSTVSLLRVSRARFSTSSTTFAPSALISELQNRPRRAFAPKASTEAGVHPDLDLTQTVATFLNPNNTPTPGAFHLRSHVAEIQRHGAARVQKALSDDPAVRERMMPVDWRIRKLVVSLNGSVRQGHLEAVVLERLIMGDGAWSDEEVEQGLWRRTGDGWWRVPTPLGEVERAHPGRGRFDGVWSDKGEGS